MKCSLLGARSLQHGPSTIMMKTTPDNGIARSRRRIVEGVVRRALPTPCSIYSHWSLRAVLFL